MEALTQIGQMLGTYGVSAVIVIIFLWDYVANKKKECRKSRDNKKYFRSSKRKHKHNL